jgi:hypothetical protein
MQVALADVTLKRFFVVHAGEYSFDLAKSIRAIARPHLLDEVKPL